VDPSSHNPNPPGVFEGSPWEWITEDSARDGEALEAVREFIERYGAMPNQRSWAAASIRPAEKTIRSRFGSFRAAIEAPAWTDPSDSMIVGDRPAAFREHQDGEQQRLRIVPPSGSRLRQQRKPRMRLGARLDRETTRS
jgi:hypothetical protein